MDVQLEEWLALEPSKLLEGLEEMAQTGLLAAFDQARVLSTSLKPQDVRTQQIADFCALRIDEAVENDPTDTRVMTALGLVIDYAGDLGRRTKAGQAFERCLKIAFAENPVRARDQVHSIRAGISTSDAVKSMTLDPLLSSINPNRKGAAAELLNIALEVSGLDETQKERVLNKTIKAAKIEPYEAMDVLRVLIENDGASGSYAIARAKDVYTQFLDDPHYLIEVLNREYPANHRELAKMLHTHKGPEIIQ